MYQKTQNVPSVKAWNKVCLTTLTAYSNQCSRRPFNLHDYLPQAAQTFGVKLESIDNKTP